MSADAARRRGRASRLAERRRAVERCLARWDLLARPRRLERAGEVEPLAEGVGRRLRGALAELGPTFAAFGAYLGTRVDVLPAADCLELAATPPPAPLPPRAVEELLSLELARPASEVFAAVAAEPCAVAWAAQAHRARLLDGTPVVVRLARDPLAAATPEQGEEIAADLELLPALAGAFAGQAWAARAVAAAAVDFRQSVLDRLNLAALATDLEQTAAETAAFGLAAPVRVRRDLSTARLLTVEDPGGLPLAAAAASGEIRPWTPAAAPRRLARALAVVWLRQALFGRLFPVELEEGDVRALPDGRLAFLGGACARPAPAEQADLRELAIAAAVRDPDGACAALLRATTQGGGAVVSVDQLRLHLRQIVPFRDGAWSAGGESLAEHLFVHARVARSCGYVPRAPLLAFVRGLFAVAAATRALDPDADALLDALQEVRVLASLAQMREALDPRAWSGPWERGAMLLSELPQRLDALLTRAAESGDGPPAAPAASAPPRGTAGAERRTALALSLAAAALLVQGLADRGLLDAAGGRWATAARSLAAVLFLVAGWILLGVGGGGGSRARG